MRRRKAGPYVMGAGAVQGSMVRMRGLEPPRVAPLEPKSSASTSSATSAKRGRVSPRCHASASGSATCTGDGDDFGAVFEMHGVEVGPAAAPDETVAFERLDDRGRDLVLVGREAVRGLVGPLPVGAVPDVQVDGQI